MECAHLWMCGHQLYGAIWRVPSATSMQLGADSNLARTEDGGLLIVKASCSHLHAAPAPAQNQLILGCAAIIFPMPYCGCRQSPLGLCAGNDRVKLGGTVNIISFGVLLHRCTASRRLLQNSARRPFGGSRRPSDLHTPQRRAGRASPTLQARTSRPQPLPCSEDIVSSALRCFSVAALHRGAFSRTVLGALSTAADDLQTSICLRAKTDAPAPPSKREDFILSRCLRYRIISFCVSKILYIIHLRRYQF